MKQCPACQNENLFPSGDGRLVCDDCGEQFAGFHEEEVDDLFAGTAVQNRLSQASQADSRRRKIAALKETPQLTLSQPSGKQIPDDLLITEGVFIMSKAIAKRLIHIKYVPKRIMHPLFEILTCWTRTLHARVDTSLAIVFKPVMILSAICLAALCVRSSMLPRDLCRLVNTFQVPYFTALRTVFPKSFPKTKAVRAAFVPQELPIATVVVAYARMLGVHKDAWPSLNEFFRKNINPSHRDQMLREMERPFHFIRNVTKVPFPLGHMHVTLLRLTRLLGLPDDFGARVLRFIDLRRAAVKMARVMNRRSDGPWDHSKIDTDRIPHIPHYRGLQDTFSIPVPEGIDLYTFPTDESLQIDIINTMRLCYGRVKMGKRPVRDIPKQMRMQMRKEWNKCKEALESWLSRGNAEDLDHVCWTCLTPRTLSTMSGATLADYVSLAEVIMTEKGEKEPELLGNIRTVFQNIAGTNRSHLEDVDYVQMEETCMYDFERVSDKPLFEPAEGAEHMDDDIVPLDTNLCGIPNFDYGRLMLRQRTQEEKHRDLRRVSEYSHWHEPIGISLAWTVMMKFFGGTTLDVSSGLLSKSFAVSTDRMRRAADRSMLIVTKYLLGLKKRRGGSGSESSSERKRRKTESSEGDNLEF